DHLIDGRRQVITDAHPLVEISLMKNTNKNVLLLHLVNNTAQLHGAGNRLIPLRSMTFSVKGEYEKVYLASGKVLTSKMENGYTSFGLDRLEEYELVVME